MQQSLFELDYTDQVLGYVQDGILKRESLDYVVNRDYVLLLIREAVRKFVPSLTFHARIEYIERIYEEYYKEGYDEKI